jgi:hypothetical protein
MGDPKGVIVIDAARESSHKNVSRSNNGSGGTLSGCEGLRAKFGRFSICPYGRVKVNMNFPSYGFADIFRVKTIHDSRWKIAVGWISFIGVISITTQALSSVLKNLSVF